MDTGRSDSPQQAAGRTPADGHLGHISIVIPCHGEGAELRVCLGALKCQTSSVPHDIWVASSGDEDAIRQVIAQFSGVKHVHSPTPLFPGGARNLGAMLAAGNWLLFLDVDCQPQPGWLAAAAAATACGARVIGGAVLQQRPCRPVAVVDNWLQFADFAAGRESGWSDNFPTCNCLIERTLFEEMGGFPTEWRIGEDGIFKTRLAQKFGATVYFCSDLRVSHAGRGTIRGFVAHQKALGYYRGLLGNRLSRPYYRSLGRWWIMVVPVVLKRFSYLIGRFWKWDHRALAGLLVLWPLVLVGLFAWATGFRSGCRTETA